MKVYGGGKDDILLPKLTVGQIVNYNEIKAVESFTRPPARYSEATLVRKLEELGIGRPSTYAPTISTIQTRGYVEKKDLEGTNREINEVKLKAGKVSKDKTTAITGADRAKLIPTPIADVVTDFLVKYFPSIVDFDFTAKVEADFDDIAAGKQTWDQMISEFYSNFHPLIVSSEDVSRNEVSKSRELGVDPKSNEPIFARFGRYGPMLVKGNIEDTEKKPQFAPMPAGTTLDSVTLEQATEIFKLPRIVGKTNDGKEIKANIGRFGPYIQVDKTFVSIKPLDPQTITLEEASRLYSDKLAKDAAKNIGEFKASGIKILNGPYGPYITDSKKNVRISKDQDPAKITEKEAIKLLKNAPAKKRSFKPKAKK